MIKQVEIQNFKPRCFPAKFLIQGIQQAWPATMVNQHIYQRNNNPIKFQVEHSCREACTNAPEQPGDTSKFGEAKKWEFHLFNSIPKWYGAKYL